MHQHELRVHFGERRKLLCPKKGCNKEFTHSFNLESHIQGDHEGKRPFSCAYEGCGKSFAMKVNLQLKSKVVCRGYGAVGQYCCEGCCVFNWNTNVPDFWVTFQKWNDEPFKLLYQESLWRHEVVHDPAKKKVKVVLWLKHLKEVPVLCGFFFFVLLPRNYVLNGISRGVWPCGAN